MLHCEALLHGIITNSTTRKMQRAERVLLGQIHSLDFQVLGKHREGSDTCLLLKKERAAFFSTQCRSSSDKEGRFLETTSIVASTCIMSYLDYRLLHNTHYRQQLGDKIAVSTSWRSILLMWYHVCYHITVSIFQSSF